MARQVRPEWHLLNVQLFDANDETCLLYTSDAADERSSVDLGGRRIIKKKQTAMVENATLITLEWGMTASKDK